MPRKKENKPEAYYDTFPVTLRDIMEKQGKTQQDVAEAIGKTRQAVGYYCDGSSSPDWKTIVAIAKYFECSVDYILGLTTTHAKDVNVDVAVKNTGLSEDALWRLRCLKDEADPDYLFIMNALIASESMDTIVREIREVRRIQQSFANKAREDIYELEEIQDEAIDQAKKVLEDAGVIGYKILSREEILDHHFRTLEGYFNFMLQVELFYEQGELYAGK